MDFSFDLSDWLSDSLSWVASLLWVACILVRDSDAIIETYRADFSSYLYRVFLSSPVDHELVEYVLVIGVGS